MLMAGQGKGGRSSQLRTGGAGGDLGGGHLATERVEKPTLRVLESIGVARGLRQWVGRHFLATERDPRVGLLVEAEHLQRG
jgi:hypothetical protein